MYRMQVMQSLVCVVALRESSLPFSWHTVQIILIVEIAGELNEWPLICSFYHFNCSGGGACV